MYFWDILTTFIYLYPKFCQKKMVSVKIDYSTENLTNALIYDDAGYSISEVIAIEKRPFYKHLLADFKKYYG